LFEGAILSPEPAQLLSLLGGKSLALAFVDLVLPDPPPQRLALAMPISSAVFGIDLLEER